MVRLGGKIRTAIARGLRRRCPQCGEGRLYRGFYTLEKRCPHCALDLGRLDEDCWGFMYLSTAFMTGLIVIGMFLVDPPSILVGRLVVVAVAFATIGLSLPFRKGVALAVSYLVELSWNNYDGLALRTPPAGVTDKKSGPAPPPR
jgi:uncharacterized protein (DUF983 family)